MYICTDKVVSQSILLVSDIARNLRVCAYYMQSVSKFSCKKTGCNWISHVFPCLTFSFSFISAGKPHFCVKGKVQIQSVYPQNYSELLSFCLLPIGLGVRDHHVLLALTTSDFQMQASSSVS